MSTDVRRITWKPIEPIGPGDGQVNGAIGSLEALREEWLRRLAALPEADRNAVRQRTLRRLAIETGILERLYDLDWGLTLNLVAEGLTRDVVERAGGQIDDRTLGTLRAHMDSLGLVVEYCPPEHVAAEMDRLIELWALLEATDGHPLVKAAWLHHRFVQIHPFADGNGRVARALTLLVMEKHRYAPLVVDRHHRPAYLQALDRANEGALGDLVVLFARLENSALASELERPSETPRGLSTEVAHTLADQIAHRRTQARDAIVQKLDVLSRAVAGRMRVWFKRKRAELEKIFRSRGLADVKVFIDEQMPPSDHAYYFRNQARRTAHLAGHSADFTAFSGSSCLRVRVQDLQMRYVAAIHGAGRDTGLMAVVTFGDIVPLQSAGIAPQEGAPEGVSEFATTHDAFRYVHTESVADVEGRAAELEELLDEGLTVALAKLLKQV